jgi:hypothetical protein
MLRRQLEKGNEKGLTFHQGYPAHLREQNIDVAPLSSRLGYFNNSTMPSFLFRRGEPWPGYFFCLVMVAGVLNNETW